MSAAPALVPDDAEVVPPKSPEANCSERVYPAILMGRVDLRVDRQQFRNHMKIQDFMGC